MSDRCQGNQAPGAWTGFECMLDAGHEGRCQPYTPPTVDEWRALQAKLPRPVVKPGIRSGRTLRCMFCGLDHWSVRRMWRGHSDHEIVCDQCIAIMVESDEADSCTPSRETVEAWAVAAMTRCAQEDK